MSDAVPRWRVVRQLMLALLTSVLLPGIAVGQPPALPSPLSLEQALTYADQPHPDLDSARAALERARARGLAAEALDSARLTLDITPERVKPTTGGPDIDDSRARLLLTKPLYDFGRTRAANAAAAAELGARESQLVDARAARRVEIMSRFFEVLLADLRYAYDNEQMAHLYVRYDRLRNRADLGQVSEVDLAEAENLYREALNTRTESEKQKVASRLRLALALNRPSELPRELVRPPSEGVARATPDYQETTGAALAGNPLLVALRKDVDAARESVAAERARRGPSLSAEVEAADWNRSLSSRSDTRAMLNLRIPLYQGGETDAAIAQAAAELAAREARLRKAEHDLRRAVLDVVQEIETLKVKHKTAQQRVSFRDLYLDRSRSLYDLEVQTNLGDAMARLTEAQWLAARADFELALAWARLDALTGKLVTSSEKEQGSP